MHRTSPFLLAVSALALALGAGLASSVTACGPGGGDTGGGGSTTMGTGGTGGSAPASGCFDYTGWDGSQPAVSFQNDVLPIFRGSCGLSMSCHGNPNGSGGQHFYGPRLADPAPSAADIQAIFDQSVNQPSVDEPTMKIIAPGDPAYSFLMFKLDGDPDAKDPNAQVSCAQLPCAVMGACLESMPQGGPRLPDDKRDLIRRWIAQGAMNN